VAAVVDAGMAIVFVVVVVVVVDGMVVALMMVELATMKVKRDGECTSPPRSSLLICHQREHHKQDLQLHMDSRCSNNSSGAGSHDDSDDSGDGERKALSREMGGGVALRLHGHGHAHAHADAARGKQLRHQVGLLVDQFHLLLLQL